MAAISLEWLDIRTPQERWLFGVTIFMIAGIVGSYLNVVIHRLPAGLSVAFPGSRCPWCRTPIRAYDNVPILSWFVLAGRCRKCRAGISIRYPLVEAIVAVTITWLFVRTVLDGGKHLPFAHYLPQLTSSDLSLWFVFGVQGLLWCTLMCWSMIRFDGSRMPFRLFRPALLLVVVAYVISSMGPLVPARFEAVDLPLPAPGYLGAIVGGLFGLVDRLSVTPLKADRYAWLAMALLGLNLGWTGITVVLLVGALSSVCCSFVAKGVPSLRRFDWSIFVAATLPVYFGCGSLIQFRLTGSDQLPTAATLLVASVVAAIALFAANRLNSIFALTDSEPTTSWTTSESNWPRRHFKARQTVTPELEANLRRILDSPSYRLAEEDADFIQRPELRALRVQMELAKPEMVFNEEGVHSTIVAFGGTQIVERADAEARLKTAQDALSESPDDEKCQRAVQRAERVLAKTRYYDEALEFSRLVSSTCQLDGRCDYVIITGGGPGIMEAANRGAFEVDAKSIGLNITLPQEQAPNPFITPELCFQFHYFALRKMHFLLRAKALIVFPGGFGTLDELFCALTLRQTGRMQEIPIIMYGKAYWDNVINLQYLADEGVIADHHLDLISFAESPEEAWRIISEFHQHD